MKKLAKLREFLWPIYGDEHRLWVPMAFMVGLILFNYTLARNIKDALVVTATGSSEIIPFIKSAVILPSSILFFLVYGKLAQLLNKQIIFYAIMSSFMLFFLFFALVLFPNSPLLHPKLDSSFFINTVPKGFKGLVDCFRVWTFVLFYVMAELWGVVALGLLFWQFANEVISLNQAKRFYAHFFLLGNIFVALSGQLVRCLSQKNQGKWGSSLTVLLLIMSAVVFAIMYLYSYLNKKVLPRTNLENKKSKHEKPKSLGLKNSFIYIVKNPFLMHIASLLLCYGITANLVEIVWKRKLVELYPDPLDYTHFMGDLSLATGISTFICIFIGSACIRKLGWKFSAFATPAFLAIFGIPFFIIVLFPDVFQFIGSGLGLSPLLFAVSTGFVLEVVVKGIKYAMFDPTKEMVYIPLDNESKTQGKAAVDVVANRLGKSLSSGLEIGTIALSGSLLLALPYFFLIFLALVLLWHFSVYRLDKALKGLD